jgi:enamine deaminase RidA (YjgF/YER057c/UK114 family)
MGMLLFPLLALAIVSQATRIVNPKELFDPRPYGFSHVAVVPANSRLIFVAGQGGEEDTKGTLHPDFRRQVQQALMNIRIALRSQKATMDQVVKVTTLVADHNPEKLQIITEEFHHIWPKGNFPVNTLIPVPKLAIEGMLVEIDAVASVE